MSEKNIKKIADECLIADVLEIVGGKWCIPIIHALFDGKKRFKELERSLYKTNTRMLVKELKQLEAHKIIKREAFATVPPTVEYSLTYRGEALKPIIQDLYDWGQKYLDR